MFRRPAAPSDPRFRDPVWVPKGQAKGSGIAGSEDNNDDDNWGTWTGTAPGDEEGEGLGTGTAPGDEAPGKGKGKGEDLSTGTVPGDEAPGKGKGKGKGQS